MNMFIDAAAALLLRCHISYGYHIPIRHITHVMTDGDGWIRYRYVSEFGPDTRYVAPHLDEQLSVSCEQWSPTCEPHDWRGEWHLDGLTLHCVTCGRDGT